jgi:hypothetical protein
MIKMQGNTDNAAEAKSSINKLPDFKKTVSEKLKDSENN